MIRRLPARFFLVRASPRRGGEGGVRARVAEGRGCGRGARREPSSLGGERDFRRLTLRRCWAGPSTSRRLVAGTGGCGDSRAFCARPRSPARRVGVLRLPSVGRRRRRPSEGEHAFEGRGTNRFANAVPPFWPALTTHGDPQRAPAARVYSSVLSAPACEPSRLEPPRSCGGPKRGRRGGAAGRPRASTLALAAHNAMPGSGPRVDPSAYAATRQANITQSRELRASAPAEWWRRLSRRINTRRAAGAQTEEGGRPGLDTTHLQEDGQELLSPRGDREDDLDAAAGVLRRARERPSFPE